jgi:molybdenum cofactor guanylyltransferase
VTADVIAGLFVGGRATRMGGRPKGLLPTASGQTIIARSRDLLGDLGVQVVLVGAHPAYGDLRIETVADAPADIGPLGGLVALLRRTGAGRALALACDMPFVSRAVLERLLRADDGAVHAPRRDGRWEPLCARYDAPRVVPVAERRARAGLHALQGLLDEVGAAELLLAAEEEPDLRDWDTPGDVAAR